MKCIKCGKTIRKTKCSGCGFDLKKDPLLSAFPLSEEYRKTLDAFRESEIQAEKRAKEKARQAAEEKQKAEEEKRKAEEEAKRQAVLAEQRRKEEAERKRKAEEEAKRQAVLAEQRQKEEAERERAAEEARKAEEEAKRQAALAGNGGRKADALHLAGAHLGGRHRKFQPFGKAG